jgi:aryl-alcohol dehydrogenase-like predicted oxidoreductase
VSRRRRYRSRNIFSEIENGFVAQDASPLHPDAWEESWTRRATDHNWKILETVNEIASKSGRTASQVSLAWLLAQPAVSSVILGARTPEQLADNLGAATIELSAGELCRLNQVSEVLLHIRIDRLPRLSADPLDRNCRK